MGHVHEVSRGANDWTDLDVTNSTNPPAAGAVGTPMGYVAACARRIVFRDENHHVRELTAGEGSWTVWDMSSIVGAADAYSEPKGYADSSGRPHVVYRDVVGDVHELYEDAGGWHHQDLTTLTHAAAALGSPMGYLAGCSPRIVYQGADHHVHELAYEGAQWNHHDLAAIRGALFTVDDPTASVGSDNVPRIEYRATDGQLHEFVYSAGWIHHDF